LLDQLGIADKARSYKDLHDSAWYPRLVDSGFTIARPSPIFPRLELPEDEAAT